MVHSPTSYCNLFLPPWLCLFVGNIFIFIFENLSIYSNLHLNDFRLVHLFSLYFWNSFFRLGLQEIFKARAGKVKDSERPVTGPVSSQSAKDRRVPDTDRGRIIGVSGPRVLHDSVTRIGKEQERGSVEQLHREEEGFLLPSQRREVHARPQSAPGRRCVRSAPRIHSGFNIITGEDR